jgi:hypothetical protein
MLETLEIEARVVNHPSSPFWYKATLHGCPFDAVIGSKNDRTITGSAKIFWYTLLTFRVAGGDMDEGFEDFWIVSADPEQPEQILGNPSNGYLKGRFEIAAHGQGERQASRLRAWWFEWAPNHGGQTFQMASWLGQQLEQASEFPEPCPNPLARVKPRLMFFYPREAWSFAPYSPSTKST